METAPASAIPTTESSGIKKEQSATSFEDNICQACRFILEANHYTKTRLENMNIQEMIDIIIKDYNAGEGFTLLLDFDGVFTDNEFPLLKLGYNQNSLDLLNKLSQGLTNANIIIYTSRPLSADRLPWINSSWKEETCAALGINVDEIHPLYQDLNWRKFEQNSKGIRMLLTNAIKSPMEKAMYLYRIIKTRVKIPGLTDNLVYYKLIPKITQKALIKIDGDSHDLPFLSQLNLEFPIYYTNKINPGSQSGWAKAIKAIENGYYLIKHVAALSSALMALTAIQLKDISKK